MLEPHGTPNIPAWVPVWVRSPCRRSELRYSLTLEDATDRECSYGSLFFPACFATADSARSQRLARPLPFRPPPPPPPLHFASGSAGALEAGALKSNAPDWGAGRNKISGTLNFQTTFTEIGFERTPPESVAVQSPLKQGPKSID